MSPKVSGGFRVGHGDDGLLVSAPRRRFGRRAEDGLAAMVSGASVGIGFLDTELRYVEANAALAAIFGVDSAIDLTPSHLGASGRHTKLLLREVLRTGQSTSVATRAARISYHRVVDPDGVAIGIGVVAVADSAGDLGMAQLRLEAETDGLTGLVNHRVFQERLRLEVDRAQRHGRALSLVMIDIDGFKQLNDTFGHQTGDDVLEAVATHLSDAVRTTDTGARIGGDEFALLLPETDSEAARVVAERAREHIHGDTTKPATSVTISVGICDLEHAGDADHLLRFADGALFWAKGNGRDGVCVYDPEIVQDLSPEQRGDRLLRNKALAGVRGLARAIDAKDHSTLLHSERVASLAGRLAEALGWPEERIAALREVALVHDVGKIGVPQEILLKDGSLTPSEYDAVKAHALLGAQIASEVLDDEQTSWLQAHHERFGGGGYPDGLVGDQIPEGAQVLSLADSWDVMTSERSYSAAMDPTEAIAECQRCAGDQFAPDLVAVLTRPGFERVLRIFANEQATRDRNEVRLAGDLGAVFDLHCECGAAECETLLEVPAEEYRAVRLSDRRYIVAVSHELPEIEETLITTEHYLVVEKS